MFRFSKELTEKIKNDYPTDVEYCKANMPWISVEDRLPAEMVKVFVAHRHKVNDMPICYDTNMIVNNKWVNIPMEWDIIAWMPIPSFDDILNANKDVLKRLKEKGD